MKYFFFFFSFICNATFALSQGDNYLGIPIAGKPPIDSIAIRNWIGLNEDPPSISSDGNYFTYKVYNKPVGNSMFVIQSTINGWKKEFSGIEPGFFSADSKQYVFKNKDTLFFLDLKMDTMKWITKVRSFKYKRSSAFSSEQKPSEWIAWIFDYTPGNLVLYDLLTGKQRIFESVIKYTFSDSANTLLLQKTSSKGKNALWWVDLPEGIARLIWSTEERSESVIGSCCISAAGQQLAFMVQEKKGEQMVNTLWYYKPGMIKPEEKVNSQTPGIDVDLFLGNSAPYFSQDECYVFFQLQERSLQKALRGEKRVDVWSYRDTVLQSTQLHHLGPTTYMAVIAVEGGRVVRLQKEYESMYSFAVKGGYAIVTYDGRGDRFWLKDEYRHELASLKDGSRKIMNAARTSDFSFSPGGRWLAYYRNGNYYSYELETGMERKMSGTVPDGILSWYSDQKGKANPDLIFPIGIGGWLDADRGLLVYDEYDIWQLDPLGKTEAINLTHGYGRRHQIKFRLTDEWNIGKKGFSIEVPLLLTALNIQNKYNGFYRTKIGDSRDPELLNMGAWTLNHNGGGYFLPANANEFDGGMKPVKARDNDTWILRRSTSTEAPNYFLTTDFKTYRPLTDLQPQKGYNWLTTELVSYSQLDGIITQGVLYKPENFDAHKKYPLIVNYYQQLSHRCYEYPTPDFANGDINIPWFVSHGYLVFTPDIHYRPGKQGLSVVNAVVAAAKYLSKRRYVDAQRIGISGHSWGGFETNYLVTHTHLFAAALVGAGSSDWVSASLSLGKGGNEESLMKNYEGLIGATLWQRQDLYLEHSPILRANQVTTPLLIFHCKADGNWEQAIEMFTALRRLAKRTWLLQYDHGSHVLGKYEDLTDFTIRVQQFFDHYLKGTPPSKWLTHGIPARLKGLETGYESDNSGRQP